MRIMLIFYKKFPLRVLSAYTGRHELQAADAGRLLLATVRAWCCVTPRAFAVMVWVTQDMAGKSCYQRSYCCWMGYCECSLSISSNFPLKCVVCISEYSAAINV